MLANGKRPKRRLEPEIKSICFQRESVEKPSVKLKLHSGLKANTCNSNFKLQKQNMRMQIQISLIIIFKAQHWFSYVGIARTVSREIRHYLLKGKLILTHSIDFDGIRNLRNDIFWLLPDFKIN